MSSDAANSGQMAAMTAAIEQLANNLEQDRGEREELRQILRDEVGVRRRWREDIEQRFGQLESRLTQGELQRARWSGALKVLAVPFGAVVVGTIGFIGWIARNAVK